MKELANLVKKLEEMYPDLMVLDKMDEWERIKLIGKVELIKEIRVMINIKG